MDINNIKDKAYGVADDIREGLSVLDRFILRRDVSTRTVISDTKNGAKLMDTGNAYSKEYPVIKVVCTAAAAIIGAALIVVKIRRDASRKRVIKHQKQELKRLRRICKDSGIDIKKKEK